MKITILAVAVGLVVLGAAQPSPLRTAYRTEQAWAIQQITSDIQEMAGKTGPVTWNVAALTPWNPNEKMVAFAAAQLGSATSAVEDSPRDQYPALLQASAAHLFSASAEVSQALEHNMRNPRAHEAAAIILGAFGLRDGAADFSDHRWVMNRMTAHLAVAAALRGTGAAMGLDGELAKITLAALANRQSAAVDMIVSVGDPSLDSPKASWQRALLMRVKQDWRLLSTPATATRLEKLEYFRARRSTLPARRAGLELEDLKETDAPDFARIAQSFSRSVVEDGYQFVADGVIRELKELDSMFEREFRRTLPDSLPDVVNERAGRLLATGHPRVLPWGAWAELSQRHIALAVADTDRFYRGTLGLPEKADSLNAAIDDVVGRLRMFSVASTGRRVGRGGEQPDLTHFRAALDVLATAPELITINYWKFLEKTAGVERIADRVPNHRTWFIEPSGQVPYDANHRARDPNVIPLNVHQALLDAAPYDSWVLWTATARRPRDAELSARASAFIRGRVGYDLWAIDREAEGTNREEWEPALRRACELTPNRCITLAERLAPTDEQAAAIEYERAFNNPALDRVVVANSSEWLVFHYERNNEPARARALAETAAKAYSHRGLRTLARLLERRGEHHEASKLYEAIFERYPNADETLAGFLYRRAVVHRDARYTKRWEEIRQRTFPNGLVPETTSPAQPRAGVHVSADSAASRRVRLQTGDIIVGVDGWRVDNEDQFEAVIAFGDQLNSHKITAWRGELFSVSVPTSHGMSLDTYPLKSGQ